MILQSNINSNEFVQSNQFWRRKLKDSFRFAVASVDSREVKPRVFWSTTFLHAFCKSAKRQKCEIWWRLVVRMHTAATEYPHTVTTTFQNTPTQTLVSHSNRELQSLRLRKQIIQRLSVVQFRKTVNCHTSQGKKSNFGHVKEKKKKIKFTPCKYTVYAVTKGLKVKCQEKKKNS